MLHQLIKGDLRLRTTRLWTEWMQMVSDVREEFSDRLERDPFWLNEAASVGILAGAAYRMGGLATTDYRITKRHSTDRRLNSDGRADLYFEHMEASWVFEFKTRFGALSPGRLADGKKDALRDIRNVRDLDGSEGKAGLICHFGSSEEHLWPKYRANVESVAATADHAWRFDELEYAFPMYILFWDV